jgi:ATP-dependent DNA helicase RecQ
LAESLHVPVLEVFTEVDEPSTPTASVSAHAREVQLRLALLPKVQLPARPVLLVDDWVRTRWTFTLAGRLLRQAGASAVLPYALHQRPWAGDV